MNSKTFQIQGYCIGGSYGEWPYLTNDEKIQILKTVKSSVHPSKFVMAGTTSECEYLKIFVI